MTKKDFRVVADALNAARPVREADFADAATWKAAQEEWEVAVRYVADALENSYPRFDREKFEAACGLEKP